LMNILLFFTFCLLAFLVILKSSVSLDLAIDSKAVFLFKIGAVLNVVLFIFNMLPVPPLDGWTVFSYLFPKIHDINPEVRNGAIVGLFFIAFFSFQYLYMIGALLTNFTLRVFCLPLTLLGAY